jgi:hypothetical protein
MKRRTPLLICLVAMSGASADSGISRSPAQHPSLAANVNAVSLPSGSRGLRDDWAVGRRSTQAGLDGLQADVVRDVRATSAFVREQAGKATAPRRWLTALTAFGLITMQLRRKHKSLPQRRIAPYG